MPLDRPHAPENAAPAAFNYDANPLWRNKPLTPAQLLVNDVRLETLQHDRGPLLEVIERSTSSLIPEYAALTPPASLVRAAEAAKNAIEKQNFTRLEEDYGWIRHLRLLKHQVHAFDDEDSAKCRWVHCSSKFPEYLRGFLWAFFDDQTAVSDCLRVLDRTVQEHERFSKHGKYFAPFFQSLRPGPHSASDKMYPLLVAVPFLDWTILGGTPALRFQVDRREGFSSSRSSAHLIRSILQHFYRLEETSDRESSQVFAKHKPWSTDRELDLKTRRWYGQYPTGLNVDELWVLAIDAEHIATFSSNQTWKSRWPPLQLASRISEVSFRNIRNTFFASDQDEEYTALTHLCACLSGALGMLHRNSWADIIMPMTDRYAGYLSHLQYRLHRSPSTKLVMDLIACQEELNIVLQITQQQIDLITDISSVLHVTKDTASEKEQAVPSPISQRPMSAVGGEPWSHPRTRATFRQLSSSQLADPLLQLLDNLQRELVDLTELRDNTDRLVTRTIQLVNIRLEDHGRAILVFTVVTIVFLPLNFVSSFFGMNVSDIRNLSQNQGLFWAVALCVTAGVVASSLFLAFSGGDIMERVMIWRDKRRERHTVTTTTPKWSRATRNEYTYRGRLFKSIGSDRDEDVG